MRTHGTKAVVRKSIGRPIENTPRTDITYRFRALPVSLKIAAGIRDVFPRNEFTLDDLLKYAEANSGNKLLDHIAGALFFLKGQDRTRREELQKQDRLVLIEWVGDNLLKNKLARAFILSRHPIFFQNNDPQELNRIAVRIGYGVVGKKIEPVLSQYLEALGRIVAQVGTTQVGRFSSLAHVNEGAWAGFFNIVQFIGSSAFSKGLSEGLPLGTVVVRERKPAQATI